jgi:hypothetical protein
MAPRFTSPFIDSARQNALDGIGEGGSRGRGEFTGAISDEPSGI